MDRLEAIVRVTALVQRNIEANQGIYTGLMVPNLQSIMDCALMPDDLFSQQITEELLSTFESGSFPTFCA
jgi:hypothetical protein